MPPSTRSHDAASIYSLFRPQGSRSQSPTTCFWLCPPAQNDEPSQHRQQNRSSPQWCCVRTSSCPAVLFAAVLFLFECAGPRLTTNVTDPTLQTTPSSVRCTQRRSSCTIVALSQLWQQMTNFGYRGGTVREGTHRLQPRCHRTSPMPPCGTGIANPTKHKQALTRTDSQPFRCVALRRCSRLRTRLSHHFQWCSDCVLRQEDWPFSPRQADCQGALIRKGRLVGTRQQAHEPRCKYHYFSHSCRKSTLLPVLRLSRHTISCPW